MADRGQRRLAVAVVAAAVLVLPAGASADPAPWLAGAAPIASPAAQRAEPAGVAVRYRGRVPGPCRARVTLTLVRGTRVLERRTVAPGRRCGVSATFRVAPFGAARLRVLQRFRGRTTSVRVADPRLGSRGIDYGLQAPMALDL